FGGGCDSSSGGRVDVFPSDGKNVRGPGMSAQIAVAVAGSESPAIPAKAPARRIEAIQGLRGLAAFSVCWFHFTNGNPTFLSPGILKSSGTLGGLGVEIFFVISGFIVPYSLYTSGYMTDLQNYG